MILFYKTAITFLIISDNFIKINLVLLILSFLKFVTSIDANLLSLWV